MIIKKFVCDKFLTEIKTWDEMSDGRLRVPVTLTRTGIFKYPYREIFPNGHPAIKITDFKDGIIHVYRSKEAVIDADKSFNSMKGMHFVDEHPKETVRPENYTKYSKGQFDGTITVREEKYNDFSLHFPETFLTVNDSKAKDLIKTGKKNQISLGYTADFDFIPGTFGGQPFDAQQINIENNHGALVKAGRAGPSVKIKTSVGDLDTVYQVDDSENIIKKEERKFYMIVKGKEIVLDALGETLVQQQFDEDKAKITELQEKVQTVDTLKAENLQLKTELAAAKSIDQEALTQERIEVIEKATQFVKDAKPETFKGKTIIEIKKMAVTDAYKDEDLSKEEEGFFNVSFRMLKAAPTKKVSGVKLSDAFNGMQNVDTLDEIDKMAKQLSNAYNPKPPETAAK